MILQNLHQHSTFCDGNDTPEEIVLEAIKKGFCGIGFSSHCYMTYADYCMTRESELEYKKTVNALKPKYADQIDVFLGLEFDPAYQGKPQGYDYLIGSMHGLRFDGVDYEFDGDPVDYQGMIDNHFGGDGLAYAREYYRQLGQLPDFAPIDIIGHFDICAKHNQAEHYFDTDCKAYRDAALGAVEALAGRVKLFEVNTGTMARGYRNIPYPQDFIIKELRNKGFGVVITSDCHYKEKMDFCFDEATELLKHCGYKEKFILTKDGFIPVPL